MKREITNIPTTKNQTPIEIALQIDENGMTTASKLYEFLELHSAHFSDWCRRNIKNNKFAIEGEDYIVFTVESENLKNQGGRPKTDYKLTSDFAKKLSMTGNTERHEQARNYFIACEQGLKIAKTKLQSENNHLEEKLVNVLENVTTTLSSINDRLSKLEESQSKKQLPANKYSRWKTNVFTKFKLLQAYVKDNSEQELSLPQTMKIVFDELQDIYDIDLSEYTDMYKCEYGLDFDVKVQTLDIINHYKDVREMFMLTLNSILEKLHIQENIEFCHKNIFDELAAQLENNE